MFVVNPNTKGYDMENRTIVHVALPSWLTSQLDELAKNNGLSRAKVAALAIAAGTRLMLTERQVILDSLTMLANTETKEA